MSKYSRTIQPGMLKKVCAVQGLQPTEEIRNARARVGADIMINGGLFNLSTGATECGLKVNGVWVRKVFGVNGLAMNGNKAQIIYMDSNRDAQWTDFIQCHGELVMAGVIKSTPKLLDKRGRTAVGTKPDGSLVTYVCTDGADALNGQQLASKMLALGCNYAVNMDGGGSSSYIGPDATILPDRKIDNFIAIYLEKTEDKPVSTGIKAADLARLVQTKLGQPYVYGAVGQVMTETMIRGFAKDNPKTYTSAYLTKTLNAVGKQAFDCAGLIKFCAWGNTSNLKYYYAATDISANTAFKYAPVIGYPSAIPEVPGLCVRFDGHIGVYIGGGYVVEARGVDFGVVKTRLADRPWTHWMQYPGVDYTGTETAASTASATTKLTLRKGNKGAVVKAMQMQLLVLGYKLPKYGADGDFGSETEAAVKAFQKAKGLVVDGIVGPKTNEKLFG